MALRGEEAPGFFGAYYEWMQTPLPRWEDIAWLREQWAWAVHGQGHHPARRRPPGGGRRRSAISVSTARRQQPRRDAGGDPPAAAVVDAVGTQIEVLLDGGIRRGSDVVKAMALGAKAVMIGRAYLWGMAANGERGVSNVLSILRSGMDEALLGLGRSSVHELSREDVLVPPGFTRDWA